MKAVKKKRLTPLGRILLGLVVVIILAGGIGSYILLSNHVEEGQEIIPAETDDPKQEMTANLIMVGDALIHSAIYQDAKQADGSYDFKPMLEYIKPIMQEYDLKYYNQETILGGSELGLSNYPRFNSPYEVGDAFGNEPYYG